MALGNSVGTVETNEKGKCWGRNAKGEKQRLRRGMKIRLGASTEQVWVRMSYEKLLHLCYGCHMIGYVAKDHQFGEWLRATHSQNLKHRDERRRMYLITNHFDLWLIHS